MNKLFVVVPMFVLAACGSAKLLTPTQADADRGAQKHQGLTLAQLTNGKALYEQHCQTCHALIAPSKESEAEWQKAVPSMSKMVNKKAGKEVLGAKEQEDILRYVLVMREAAKK